MLVWLISTFSHEMQRINWLNETATNFNESVLTLLESLKEITFMQSWARYLVLRYKIQATRYLYCSRYICILDTIAKNLQKDTSYKIHFVQKKISSYKLQDTLVFKFILRYKIQDTVSRYFVKIQDTFHSLQAFRMILETTKVNPGQPLPS